MCLSNLVFLPPLIFLPPNFHENMHDFRSPLVFSRTQAASMLQWSRRPCLRRVNADRVTERTCIKEKVHVQQALPRAPTCSENWSSNSPGRRDCRDDVEISDVPRAAALMRMCWDESVQQQQQPAAAGPVHRMRAAWWRRHGNAAATWQSRRKSLTAVHATVIKQQLDKKPMFPHDTMIQHWYCSAIWLDWIEQGLTSLPTQYRLSGRQFYRWKDPTNSIKVLKEKLASHSTEEAQNPPGAYTTVLQVDV